MPRYCAISCGNSSDIQLINLVTDVVKCSQVITSVNGVGDLHTIMIDEKTRVSSIYIPYSFRDAHIAQGLSVVPTSHTSTTLTPPLKLSKSHGAAWAQIIGHQIGKLSSRVGFEPEFSVLQDTAFSKVWAFWYFSVCRNHFRSNR